MDADLQVIRALARSHRVFVLTGAGMSVESGLPTFRGVHAIQPIQGRAEDLATPQAFARDPLTVWRWYNQRIAAYGSAEPNAGHYALAQLASHVPDLTIATQNVDSLHVRAGSSGVLELHGHLREARCTRCCAVVPIERGLDESRIEHECGGRFRPQVVWFGEALPADVWERAADAASRADMILVVGTSAVVYPAAALADANRDAFVAEINPDETPLSDRCACAIREGAAIALPRIVRGLRDLLS